jgi:hypothetical protein
MPKIITQQLEESELEYKQLESILMEEYAERDSLEDELDDLELSFNLEK